MSVRFLIGSGKGKRLRAAALSLLVCLGVHAQGTVTVSGIITDEGDVPMIGASVLVSGTSNGVMAGIDGDYSITAPVGSTLEFQFIGYVTQSFKVTGGMTKLDVKLLPDAILVDEAVVIGYGSVKKEDLTGSVANVKMSDIKDVPVMSVDQAVQGRIAGADIMSTTGEPGATSTIRIRGTRSISASNEPLIVVDGVMDAVSDLGDINSADIESLTILKDASSTAIYGSRGSNGVIIITTKKGLEGSGKPSVTLKLDAGFAQLAGKLDLMDQSEFARYRNDYAYFSSTWPNVGATTALAAYPFPDPYSLGKGTDWIREITRTAPYQNYNLSLSGGNKKIKYFASLGYNDTQGIIRASGMRRISGRINLDYQIFKWLNIGYKGSYTHRNQDNNLAEVGGRNYWRAAMYLSPMLSADSDYNPLWGNGQKINTPRAMIDRNTYNTKRLSTNHTLYAEFTLAKDLKFKSQNSYYVYQRHIYRYYPSTLPAKTEGEGGEAYRGEYDETALSSENTINWLFEKNAHHVDLVGGFTAYKYQSNNFTLSGSGYMEDEVKWNNLNAVLDKETYNAASAVVNKTKLSVLARVNYNWKQRYYLTFTGRFDGASNFASSRKWAFFPSGALKWNVAKEPFMRNVRWIDDLSLRLSAGRTGNDAIGAYRSLAALSSTTTGYLFGGSQPVAFWQSRLASPELTWEKTDLYNIAADFSFLKGRINFTAEAYISTTTDLLLTVQTPTQTGYDSRFANLGKTTNKGLEFSLETHNIETKDFTWTTNLTLSRNVQMVDDIGTDDFVVAMSSAGNNPYMMMGYVKGYPLNAMWGFMYAGVWKNENELRRNEYTRTYASATQISNYTAALGQPRYYDTNHDGTLSQEDLVYLGNADPYLYGGFQNNFHIGNFNIGVYFTYSLGGKIYNYSELYMSGSYMTNQYRYMLGAWHPVRNPESNLPRAGAYDVDVPSDRIIHDASYIRLKNITLGYKFDLSKYSFFKDLTLSVSGDNLYLWKKYNGFDPDVSSGDEGDATVRRVDLGAYPKSRTIVFSIQLRY